VIAAFSSQTELSHVEQEEIPYGRVIGLSALRDEESGEPTLIRGDKDGCIRIAHADMETISDLVVERMKQVSCRICGKPIIDFDGNNACVECEISEIQAIDEEE